MSQLNPNDGPVPSASEVREVAVEAAQTAGSILRAGFGNVQSIRFKGEVDVVTEVDEQAEQAIVALIRRRFPTHGVLAEEGSPGGADTRFRWIVDPLDGTTNFAHGLPIFCTSIAFAQDGQVLVGAIYDPLRDEMFLAQRGTGATLNGRPLAVTPTDLLIRALLATGFPYDRTYLPRALAFFSELCRTSRAVRRLGSAALDCAYVASGRLDGYFEAIISPWDIAAGSLLVTEAGGAVSSLSGGPFDLYGGEILATNGQLHSTLVEALAGVDRSRQL
jgi:myo-inositol-1(or 4)-monophosphatase